MSTKKNQGDRGCKARIIACIFIIILILCVFSPVEGAGSKMTVGDVILKTDQLRNQTQSGGMNIPVGVISNGVIGLKNAQDSGDLPPEVLVLTEGKRSEGTAMLEIVHDIAPDSSLLYADFGGGREQDFVNAVENLVASGARVIVDDVGFLQVSYFEDGTLASKLNQILERHPDVILVSAAGNNADAHYQGSFSDDGNGYHSFGGKTGIPVTINPGGTVSVFLQWDDPFRASGNDYNLYLVEDGELIGMSERTQTGSEIPIEKFTYHNSGKQAVQAEIRVAKAGVNTESKTLELFINTQKDKVFVAHEFLIPEDSIIGQAAVPKVISVAAISPGDIPHIAKYSSNGYVTISWPQPEKRLKPDITGVSNVDVTGSGGFPKTFPGTSAAAPHIAGLIALEWSLFPALPADEIRNCLFNSTLELGAPGWDPVFGYGLPDALKMYEQLKGISTGSTPASIPSPVVQIPTELMGTPAIPPGMIMGPVTITEPGIYTLGTDIFDYSGVIIKVAVSDVTVIGAGHTVEGTSMQFVDEASISQSGIIIQSPDTMRLRNIVIQDISITSTTGGIIGSGVDGLIIDGCQLPYNSNGIELKDSKNGVITGCKISGNSNTGIIVTDGSDNTTIENNIIQNNLFGINTEGSTNNHLKNNDIRDNRRDNQTPSNPQVDPVPAPAAAPSGKAPCKDTNFDGVCDDQSTKTQQPVKPSTFSQTISITQTGPAYDDSDGSDPGWGESYPEESYPEPVATCPETGLPL